MIVTRRSSLAALASFLAAARLGARADGADLTPLAFGTMAGDAAGESFYAVEQGYFKDAGFDAKLTVLNNTASLASAVAGDSLAIGFGSCIPIGRAFLRGINFKYIAPAAVYEGPPTPNVVMAAKSSTYASGKDLNGQIVAVNGLNDLTHYETLAWLDQTGGDLKQIRVIETPFSEIPSALAQGRVAAGSLAEPFTTAALDTCKVIGDAAAPVGKRYMVTGWFASTAWLDKNPGDAKKLQTMLLQVAKWANTHHAQTAPILAKYNKVTLDVAMKMTRSHYGETKLTPAIMQPVLDLASKYGEMPKVSAADLIWNG
jgi:NitT/TauT family transport system substrate-binding protein